MPTGSERRFALTLVIPVGPNDDAALQNLLASIDRQAFPKERLEVLICREGNSEEARARGIALAQGEIIGCLDADNQLVGFEFLDRMARAARQPAVVGAFPSHYAYFTDDPPLNRYFALLGANDPLCWWLGKADRQSYLVAPYIGRVVYHGSPSLGSNGFFVKREAVQPFVQHWARGHTDGCEAMRLAGYDTYEVVEGVIWHRTGDTFWGWVRKRYGYARRLYFGQHQQRLWHMVHNRRDWLMVLTFVAASGLLLPHLWVAIRGYRRHRDLCWLVHPIACGALTLVYGIAVLEHAMRCLYTTLIGCRITNDPH